MARAAWNEWGNGGVLLLSAQASPGGEWGATQNLGPTDGNTLALAADAAGATHVLWAWAGALRYLKQP